MGAKDPWAAFTGDQHAFAMQDENRFIGIDGHSILYFQNGKVDTLKDIAGKGYLIYNCIRVPDGYLVVDEKDRTYLFDPAAKTVRKLATPSTFRAYSINGHSLESTTFGNRTLISSGGSIFSLENGDSSLVQEGLRSYRDSSLIESERVYSISRAKPNGNIYISGQELVYRLRGRIPPAPVAIQKRKSAAGKAAGPLSGKPEMPVLINGRKLRSAGSCKVFPGKGY